MLSSSSAFQLKFQPFFFVTCIKSALVKRKTSVAKLSPEIVFWIEFVSLSTMKPSAIDFGAYQINLQKIYCNTDFALLVEKPIHLKLDFCCHHFRF